jgi:hypothetical protein
MTAAPAGGVRWPAGGACKRPQHHIETTYKDKLECMLGCVRTGHDTRPIKSVRYRSEHAPLRIERNAPLARQDDAPAP